jgi:hypothetical protein
MTSYIPSLEAIETVNVVTASWDAEQGLADGTAVSARIKSETNGLHGSRFEYHSDNVLKGRPSFTPVNFRKPKFIDNQFGATVGGPIVKGRLFSLESFQESPQMFSLPGRLILEQDNRGTGALRAIQPHERLDLRRPARLLRHLARRFVRAKHSLFQQLLPQSAVDKLQPLAGGQSRVPRPPPVDLSRRSRPPQSFNLLIPAVDRPGRRPSPARRASGLPCSPAGKSRT